MDIRLFVSCLARAFAKDALETVLTPFGLRWLPDGLEDYYEKRKEPRTWVLELEAVVTPLRADSGWERLRLPPSSRGVVSYPTHWRSLCPGKERLPQEGGLRCDAWRWWRLCWRRW